MSQIRTFIMLSMLAAFLTASRVGVPEPEIGTREESYTVTLEHLCPDMPTDDAMECKHSALLAEGVAHVLKNGSDSVTHGDKTLDFVTCYSNSIPSFNMNLSMYCYFKGVKEEHKYEYTQVESVEDLIQIELDLLEKREKVKSKPSFYNYFSEMITYVEQIKSNFDTLVASEHTRIDVASGGYNTARDISA